MNKLKIKISYIAYEKLQHMLKNNPEYDCIKFIFSEGCCKNQVSVLLDTIDPSCILDKVDNISIIYDSALVENISEIQLVFRNNKFLIKSINKNTSCNKCSKSCNGCKGSCKKDLNT